MATIPTTTTTASSGGTDLLGNSASATAVTPAVPSTTNTAPVTSGSFPQTPTGVGLGATGVPVDVNMSAAQFVAEYDISSTEEPVYVTSNGQLTEAAVMLMQFKAMDAGQRETYEEALVNAGLLSAASANGAASTTAVNAFKTAIGTAAATGLDVATYLDQYTGVNNLNTQVSAAISAAQKEAEAPTTATLENPTTLAATITNAFDQALGFAPDQDQVSAFIGQVQGQDLANYEAPHQAAEAQLQQLQSDQAQISKMGPQDVDAITQAYLNAIHGLNPLAGGSNQQGPATGTATAPGMPNSNPAGVVAGPVGPGTTTTQQIPRGGLGALAGLFVPGMGTTHPVTTTTNPNAPLVPAREAPIGAPGTIPTYGGKYALTPADWSQAQKLYAPASKYSSAGQAPVSVQDAAFNSLLLNVLDNNGGNVANAIVTIAGGSPHGDVPATKQNAQTFATGIANEVNNQLSAFASQIQNESVTGKTTAPDAAAEAAAAAKEADPTGYYAANYASWGSLLTKMLYGTPLTSMESASDTFTGPVGSISTELGTNAAATPTTAAQAAPMNTPAPATATA